MSALWVLALATSSLGFAGTRPPEPQFSGEYGLSVLYDSSEVKVGWLTAGLHEGKLIVLADGDTLADFATPESRSHSATFPMPKDGSFELEYGVAPGSADWQRTEIDLKRAERLAPYAVTGADSIFVLGDTHGEFDRVRRLLANAGIIDSDDRWSGGSSQLVFLGDMFDRGNDVTALLWFIYRLEREAEADGGRVHVVLGNHEIMVMSNDLRYVAPKEEMVAYLRGAGYAELFNPRNSVLGSWLATKPAVLKIDEVLLAHGGVSPAYLPYSLKDFRDTLSAYISRDYFGRWDDSTFWANYPREAWPDTAAYGRHWDFFWAPNSVFWYRGYLRPPRPAMPVVDSAAVDTTAVDSAAVDTTAVDTTAAYGIQTGATDTVGLDRAVWDSLSAARIAKVLKRYGASVHVVGHTTVGTIEELFGGTLIAVDMEEAGTEMLLLRRSGDGGRRERLRFTLEGPPVALSPDSTRSVGP